VSTKRRLTPEQSRLAALEAARILLISEGAQAVTLKAVAAKIGRTHANLLHHFGAASELHKALAEYLATKICTAIADVVVATRSGEATARMVVDMIFDAFEREGGGQLVGWLQITGNNDALKPIIDAIHNNVEQTHDIGGHCMRHMTQTLVLLALGDALMGAPLAVSLELPRSAARDVAENLLINEWQRLGVVTGVEARPLAF
jgi:AcrR family transcriptional regulator